MILRKNKKFTHKNKRWISCFNKHDRNIIPQCGMLAIPLPPPFLSCSYQFCSYPPCLAPIPAWRGRESGSLRLAQISTFSFLSVSRSIPYSEYGHFFTFLWEYHRNCRTTATTMKGSNPFYKIRRIGIVVLGNLLKTMQFHI